MCSFKIILKRAYFFGEHEKEKFLGEPGAPPHLWSDQLKLDTSIKICPNHLLMWLHIKLKISLK